MACVYWSTSICIVSAAQATRRNLVFQCTYAVYGSTFGQDEHFLDTVYHVQSGGSATRIRRSR
jgi:hypothetical protein